MMRKLPRLKKNLAQQADLESVRLKKTRIEDENWRKELRAIRAEIQQADARAKDLEP